MMSSRTLSIVTPVRNGAKYLQQCIESVLAQDCESVEHIFVDGCSVDGTVEILERYAARYPNRVRFETQDEPGCGAAWNKGLRLAKGEILGWLGADDMSEAGAIKRVLKLFDEVPEACFVHGGCHFTDENGKITRTHAAREFSLDELINEQNVVAWPSAFYRRTVLDRVGKLDHYGNDFDFMIRIAKQFPIHKVDEVLSRFRVHGASETGNFESYVAVMEKDFLVSRKHGGRLFSNFGRRYFMSILIKRLGLVPVFSMLRRRRRA